MQMLHIVLFYLRFCTALSAELPTATSVTAIRYEYTSVLSREEKREEERISEERIFINGDPVTPEDSENGLTGVIGLMSSSNISSSLQDALMIFVKTFNSTIEDHTYQRFRECKLKGYQVMHVNEWIKHNGKEILSLDPSTDTWTTLNPQAVLLKQELDRETERTVRDRMRFQEACAELVKKLSHTGSTSGGVMAGVLAPLLAVFIFLGLILFSFIISKRSSAQPGAVLGSIVHYPTQDSDEEPAIQPSLSIKASLLSNMP